MLEPTRPKPADPGRTPVVGGNFGADKLAKVAAESGIASAQHGDRFPDSRAPLQGARHGARGVVRRAAAGLAEPPRAGGLAVIVEFDFVSTTFGVALQSVY